MAGPAYERTMMILTIVAMTATVTSMILTGSIALKCNGKLARKLEQFFGVRIAE